MDMNSIMESLMPYIMAALVAAFVYAAQWFRAKTQLLTEATKDIKRATEDNRVLLEKNTVLTESIERHSNGMSEKLAQIAATTAFSAGKIKAKDEAGEELDASEREELDDFERGNISLRLEDQAGESVK